MNASHPDIQSAQAAANAGERDKAVALIAGLFRQGALLGDHWLDVAQLALALGEISQALKAVKRYARVDRKDVMRQLQTAALLAEAGQVREAHSLMLSVSKKAPNNPSLDHFLGTAKALLGDGQGALSYFRKVLAKWPQAGQSWFALGALKTFTPDDPELAQMENLRGAFGGIDPHSHGAFLYTLGKAREDIGDTEGAFSRYDEGAKLFRQSRPLDRQIDQSLCTSLLSGFNAAGLAQLPPSHNITTRPIFVTGLPRSGTTLIEQILVSHSKVKDGGELELFKKALMPLGGYTFEHAATFANAANHDDPWTSIGDTYLHLLEERFGGGGHIVDKTLLHSRLMGHICHILPAAKIIWVRRDPADTAWSCYKTYFNKGLDWTWSLADIAAYFKREDLLFAHWRTLFPKNIHVVSYEELVRAPEAVIPGVLAHCALDDEPQTRRFYETRRSVTTASLAQVRKPISQKSVGSWKAYEAQMAPFINAYFEP